jgi:hypothetical protein
MTLDDYIIANAGRGDEGSFLREFAESEVFFALAESPQHLPDGAATVKPGAELRLQFVKLEAGQLGLFYASKSDPRLGKRYGGMPLMRAAELICQLQGIDGMLIQSSTDAWFGCLKDALRGFVKDVGARK